MVDLVQGRWFTGRLYDPSEGDYVCLSRDTPADKVMFAVQYGQDDNQTVRFAVYHDKSHKPYQHRFVSPTAASKLIQGAGARSGLAGDYLRNC